jgi:aminoglycoside phosphotransferase (APT) family kinase protein
MFDQFVGTKPVEERHRLDNARLDAYMRANVEGYSGTLEVAQFKGGQSNPTYRLSAGGRNYVLRKKPPGKLLPSAHAVDREFKVIKALHGAGFPVPRPYALCEDMGSSARCSSSWTASRAACCGTRPCPA